MQTAMSRHSFKTKNYKTMINNSQTINDKLRRTSLVQPLHMIYMIMFMTTMKMRSNVREARVIEGEREDAALVGHVGVSSRGCLHWIVGRCCCSIMGRVLG